MNPVALDRTGWRVEAAPVVEASIAGTIDGDGSMMTVRVLVEVSPFWAAATY